MYIVGAGMAGCLAGALCAPATILEARDSPPDYHRAVLRFRSNKIAMATGIEFREVQVHKGIWFDGTEHHLTPRMINLYSQKVSDKFMSRSITKLDTVTRYIAPEDFHHRLAEMCGNRIQYGVDDAFAMAEAYGPVISTIPMPALAKIFCKEHLLSGEEFKSKQIGVLRYHIPNCDVFQTIYYPSPSTPVYRASITGDILMIEYTGDGEHIHNNIVDVANSFGINFSSLVFIDESVQSLGKIAPIDDKKRKQFMFEMSREHGIFSLGRFACWRNILLDDVYEDIYKVRKMIKGGLYEAHKEMSNGS